MTNCKKSTVKMHSTVTVGTKWQVVIPLEVRDLLWIKPWDTLIVITKDNVALWMTKTDNIDDLLEYIKKENAS